MKKGTKKYSVTLQIGLEVFNYTAYSTCKENAVYEVLNRFDYSYRSNIKVLEVR